MFSEERDDDEIFVFETILLILVDLILGGELIGPGNRCVLYASATCT